jgi:hypothetical protein
LTNSPPRTPQTLEQRDSVLFSFGLNSLGYDPMITTASPPHLLL